MLAYNLDKYIEQAISSVLMQKTNFSFELVIGEDCSSDGTRDICKKYKKKFPSLIKLLLNEQNLGMQRNFEHTINSCGGEFIAFLEADDYWNDPYKLQKQINFLNNNLNYGMVHSDIDLYLVIRKKIINNIQKRKYNMIPTGYIYEEFLIRSFINTCTVCVRSEILKSMEIQKLLTGEDRLICDRSLWLEISLITQIGYIDESLATYRVLEESQSHSRDSINGLKKFKQGFAIRFYYVKKYGCSCETKKELKFQYNQKLLEFAFRMKDKALASSAYLSLIINKTHRKPVLIANNRKITFKDKLHYLGSKKILGTIIRYIYFGQLYFKLGVESIIARIKIG